MVIRYIDISDPPESEQGEILRGLSQLRQCLPDGWLVDLVPRTPLPVMSRKPVTRAVRITGPDQSSAVIPTQVRIRLDPQNVLLVAHKAKAMLGSEPLLVMAPYLSPSTQKALRDEGMSYLDFTGNIRLTLRCPGLYIEAKGATEEPGRKERPARSLKGNKAGRLVRALVDQKIPPGVRRLANMAGVDPGYASRVLAFLTVEALVERAPRGELLKVEWEKLLRRWAQESPFEKRGHRASFIEPRGLSGFMERLKAERSRYAVTGSMAATQWAPIAPPRLLVVYTENAEALAKGLGLRPTDTGANVILIKPADDYVFGGATHREGISYAALTQVAADLLTSPGRGPAEGDELLTWMRDHEEVWRG